MDKREGIIVSEGEKDCPIVHLKINGNYVHVFNANEQIFDPDEEMFLFNKIWTRPAYIWRVVMNGTIEYGLFKTKYIKVISYDREPFWTEERAEKMIIKYNRSPTKVPYEYFTEKIAEMFIMKCDVCSNLKIIPNYVKTKQLCKTAIKYIHDNDYDLHDAVLNGGIPEELCDTEIMVMIAECNSGIIPHLPAKLKTEDFYMECMKRDMWTMVKHTPTNLVPDEILTKRIRQFDFAIGYIPKRLITENLCNLAVTMHKSAIYYVPEKFLSENLCRLVLELHGVVGYDYSGMPKQFYELNNGNWIVKKDIFLNFKRNSIRKKISHRMYQQQENMMHNMDKVSDNNSI